MYDETMTVRIHGAGRSNIWDVHGKNAGAQGVWMGQDEVEGLFSAPIRQAWNSGAQQVGGTQEGVWHDVRDLMLGFHVTDRIWPFSTTDALFRQSFEEQVDRWDHDATQAMIEVHTEMSGSRFLDVLAYDKRDFNPGTDPLVQGYGNPALPLRAGQPHYYSADDVSIFSSTATSASGTIRVWNPTPLPCYYKVEVTRCQATLPDVSWAGPKGARVPGVDKRSKRNDAARTILLPLITSTHGMATVDLDYLNGDAIPIRDASDQNMIGQMPVPGQFFMHAIPPHTPPTDLPVSYTNAPAGGAMIRYIMPRRWPEPFGGEWMGNIA